MSLSTKAVKVIDQTQDLSGSEQYRLTKLYTPPDFVKQASHEQLHGNPEELQSHVYADSVKRLFPCHTKAATWMSALFFADKRKQIEPQFVEGIATRIIKSAAYWNIEPVVKGLWEKIAAEEASGFARLGDDSFAMVWAAGGRKERHYPLRNSNEVKMASAWFTQYHGDFSFPDKHVIAKKILTKAAEFAAPLENPDLLDRCAGFGYCAAETAARAWEKRSQLVRSQHPEYAIEAVKLATTIRDSTFEARDVGKRVKMAELMENFDHQTGLSKMYDDGGLERPEEILFAITEKVATQFLGQHVQTTNGSIYEKTALAQLELSDIRSWLGDELAEAVSTGSVLDLEKLAEIVPTLPKPDADMFETMAHATGVGVFAREKESASTTFTLAEMRELATAYQPKD